MECHQDSLGQLNITVICVVNDTSVISIAHVELCKTDNMTNDGRGLTVNLLCSQFHKLCAVVDCAAACNETLVGSPAVCSQCTEQSAHCSVVPSHMTPAGSRTTRPNNGTNNGSSNSGACTRSSYMHLQYHNSRQTIIFPCWLVFPLLCTGKAAITRGSTAVIVLLCILGLVCLGGTCARHKHWSWQSSSSNGKPIYDIHEISIHCTDMAMHDTLLQ